MKVSSPVGDYPYEVRAVRLRGASIVIEGDLGVWQTAMEIEPRDWLAVARRALAPAGALAIAVALVRSRRR